MLIILDFVLWKGIEKDATPRLEKASQLRPFRLFPFPSKSLISHALIC